MFMLILFKLVQIIWIYIVRIIHNSQQTTEKRSLQHVILLFVWLLIDHSQSHSRWKESVAPESRQT